MGSNEIDQLQYRESFAFIGISGGRKQANEKRGQQNQDIINQNPFASEEALQVSATQIFRVPLEFKAKQFSQAITAKRQLFELISSIKDSVRQELSTDKILELFS